MFFRLIGYLFGIGTLLAILAIGGIAWYVSDLSKDLPDYEVLNAYEPPVTTRVHAGDGSLMAEYARERRLYLPIQAIPSLVKNAFISAEDKNFYSHFGIDPEGLARAVVTNIRQMGSNKRAIGASTITQQVAKNFLLSNERTVDRKIKEAILALRIEQAYSKDRILELYLNEIFLGLGSYGVPGASLTYFDKTVNGLQLHEAAYLAALPKGPNNYHPFNNTEDAIERRNWVIDRMVANGYVTVEEGEKAKALGLDVNPRRRSSYLASSEYFAEETRREIVERYGEDALYEGGLSIRTTLIAAAAFTGLAYLFIWELFVARVGAGAAKLSISTYPASVLARLSDIELPLAERSMFTGIVVPLVVPLVAVVLTRWRLDRMDIA